MKKTIRIVLIIVICLAVAGGGTYYFLMPDTLKVTTVSHGTVSPELTGTGILHGNRTMTVYSDVGGVIDERYVEVGDRVKKGDLLIGYSGDTQQTEVDLAATDVEFSEKILGAASDNRADYLGKYNAAKKKITECEQVYALLESQIMALNSGVYLSDYELNQRKKNCEADIAKMQGEIADKQAELSKLEADLKAAELKEDTKNVDKLVAKAKEYQDEIGDLNESISKVQRDEICLPQEGMDPATHDRYLVLENNLDTVMRIWTEARTDKDTYQSMLTAYQEIYADEQQVERDKISLTQAEKELQKAVNGTASPEDGIITECLVDVGAYVEKGVPVMELQSADSYKVKMSVSKYDIAQVHEGQKAEIKIGNIRYGGKVSKISQAAESDVSGKAKAAVEIDIDTKDDLIVGLEADVTLKLEEATDVLRVPTECIYQDDDGTFVYITDKREVRKAYVTTGYKDSLFTEVRGIAEGTHVVNDPEAPTHVGEKILEDL